jgi:hypothetical protein
MSNHINVNNTLNVMFMQKKTVYGRICTIISRLSSLQVDQTVT